MMDSLPLTFFRPEWIKPFLQDDNQSHTSQLFVHVCNFFALNFQSKPAISAPADSLEKGCNVASTVALVPTSASATSFRTLW
jgi:hypothetical protein